MSTETRKGRPAGNQAANTSTSTGTRIPVQADESWPETFARRVIADALCEANAAYWSRRASVFEDAAPRPGDFHGKATRDELDAAWRRCMADAARCRRHAALMRDREVSAARDDWADLLTLEVPGE